MDKKTFFINFHKRLAEKYTTSDFVIEKVRGVMLGKLKKASTIIEAINFFESVKERKRRPAGGTKGLYPARSRGKMKYSRVIAFLKRITTGQLLDIIQKTEYDL